MFIGKLCGAVFDPLPCLDKIMDGLLSSGITAQAPSWMLLVEVPLSKFVCSEVDPAVWEPNTVAGLQHDEEALCAWDFLSLIPKPLNVLKIALTTVCQAFLLSFSLRTNPLLHL